MEYVLERLVGGKWKRVASFKHGEPSRFNGEPFDFDIAIKEAQSYMAFWNLNNGFVKVSVVI